MVSLVGEFIQAPSEEILHQCTKDELLKIPHFKVLTLGTKGLWCALKVSGYHCVSDCSFDN